MVFLGFMCVLLLGSLAWAYVSFKLEEWRDTW